MIKAVIFDFDGVIADSFSYFYLINRDAMARVGVDLSEEQYKNLFLGNVHLGFKDFIESAEGYKKFLEYKKLHSLDYDKKKIFPGVVDFLKTLKIHDYKLSICSSGNRENILGTLAANEIQDVFDLILATSEYSKEAIVRQTLGEFNAKPEEAILITDTAGDIKVAQELGLYSIAVTWGFHSQEILEASNPGAIVSNFHDLLDEIVELTKV